MGNSLGCSPSGERLVSAARDGDLREAQALLEYNPRLVKYSTFGGRNSPIHFAAAQGHNEMVALLLETGVDVNARNYSGQTALMQACKNGHWEVVQTLILFKANVNRADYLNGRTALHFAAINGDVRCIRLLFADYFPCIPYLGNESSKFASEEDSSVKTCLDMNATTRIVNRPADGGITALHMSALNGHTDCVLLLLDLMANVTAVTVQDGTTIDLIGAGSTALHYAACGGNATCCQVLISRGASRTVQNSNGWTPQQVARLWRRHWLESLLDPAADSQGPLASIPPSRYLSIPLMSIIKIAREYGWRNLESCTGVADGCAVCLERKCTVAAEGCSHELCTRCALYLCSTNNAATISGPSGSIPCPLCRHGITSFVKLRSTPTVKDLARPNLSLSLCTVCSTQVSESTFSGHISKIEYGGCKVCPESASARCGMNCPGFPVINLHFTCNGDAEDETPPVARCNSAKSERRRDPCSWSSPRNSLSSCSVLDGRWYSHTTLSTGDAVS